MSDKIIPQTAVEGASHHNGTAPQAKPEPLQVLAENIPDELKALPQWVTWRFDWDEKRAVFVKVPYQANGTHKASSTAPDTWGTFDACLQSYAAGRVDGIGIVLSEIDEYTGIDLDGCINSDTGESEADALAVVGTFDSYTEISPSGTGARILIRAKMPRDANGKTRNRTAASWKRDGQKGDIEIYDTARFLTITGHHWSGTPRTIETRQSELDTLHADLFPPQKPTQTRAASTCEPLSLSDNELLEKAFAAKNGGKIRALYGGDTSAHNSPSEADSALCCHLAFYTRDAAQIERIWLSSGLARDKAEREDYRQRTIENALEKVTETYKPKRSKTAKSDILSGGEIGKVLPDKGHRLPFDVQTLTTGYPCNDMGNGKRFVSQHGHRVRFCAEWKSWLVYEGGRWLRDDKGSINERAKLTAELVVQEAMSEEDADRRAALLSHAAKLTRRAARETMLKDASTIDGIPILTNELDTDQWLFNVQNGTINLRTGELQPHDPTNLISKMANVAYDPKAKCPRFEAFLQTTFSSKTEMISALRRALGHTLTGDTREQIFMIAIGGGSNGKSTLLQAIIRLMGDYAIEIEPTTIMVQKNERMAVDIADLFNVRLVVTSESNDTQRLDEAKVKKFVGGEMLTGERKFEHPFKFVPVFKPILATNHLPEIRDTGHSIWRRIIPIPFDVQFWDADKGESGAPEFKADKTLLDTFKSEASGILNWLIEGCLEWQQDGLKWPSEVLERKQDYREEQDIIAPFLAACCELKPTGKVSKTELYKAYKTYCGDETTPLHTNNFGKRLKGHAGISDGRESDSARTRFWKGIALIGDETAI